MAIQRFQPTSSLLQQFNDEINRMFLGETDAVPAFAGGSWRPAVDIHENADAYLIDAEIPGIDPADIEVTLDKGVLTLKGERRSTHEKAAEAAGDNDGGRGEQTRHIERSYGRFVRRFSLPETADENSVEATAENGVLRLSIAKKPQSQPRRIEVKG